MGVELRSEYGYFYSFDPKLDRYVCTLEGELPDTVISIPHDFGQMLLWTGWGINKLSECSKNVYLYEKMEGKAENMGDFIEKRYKSKDEIKRNKRLFLRRERYDNDNNTKVKYDKKDFIKENTGK